MSVDSSFPGLAAEPASDVGTVSLACRRRILEREGIPMFLALQDARPGRTLQVTDAAARAEGARLATLFDHYQQAVAELPPEGRPVEPDIDAPADPARAVTDVTGAGPLIDVLVVLSDQHLRPRRSGSAENGESS